MGSCLSSRLRCQKILLRLSRPSLGASICCLALTGAVNLKGHTLSHGSYPSFLMKMNTRGLYSISVSMLPRVINAKVLK